MVTLTVPVAAVLLAARVRLEVPGVPTDAGLKLAVTPEGSPDADNATAELNPPSAEVDTVTPAELPCVRDTLEGARLKVKSGGCAAVTVTAIVVVCVTPPPVAVTVMLKVPAAAMLLAEIVIVELPVPGAAMEAGLKVAVTPEGRPDADRVIAELKPPVAVVETVLLAALPWFMLTAAGVAVTMKSGVTCFHTSAIAVALAALPA